MTTLRRDAQRNREKLVDAARAVFAERGLDVPLDEIARRAGVSIGTLYNRFPNRNALAAAVFADREETVRQLAGQALAKDDPWDGFVHFVEQICRLMAEDRGWNDVSALRAPEIGRALMISVVERAQGAGALREDFTLTDMAFVIWSMTRTIAATREVAPEMWRRHLGFVLDGLRAAAAHPLPGPAPLSEADAARLVGGC